MDWSKYSNEVLSKIDIKAFYYAELNNITQHGDEIKAECPFASTRHKEGTDKTPSFTVNTHRGVYICKTCQAKGNIHTFYKEKYHLDSIQAWYELGDALKITRPGKKDKPIINDALVGIYHNELMNIIAPIREILKTKRGIEDSTLRKFSIGWEVESRRITIPIYNEFMQLINIRLYKWDDPNYKVLNYKDPNGNTYGEVAIFGIENLTMYDHSNILWCEGEMDRLVAEQCGIAAACATSGAGTWRPEWAKFFRHKTVIIAQDNDEAGRRSTITLAKKLNYVANVKVIEWPFLFKEKGDITDYYIQYGKEALQELINKAIPYSIVDKKKDIETVQVSLIDATKHQYYGKLLKINALLAGKDFTPYLIPKIIEASCELNNKCNACELCSYAGYRVYTIDIFNKQLLQLMKCTKLKQQAVIKELFGIIPTCRVVDFNVKEYLNIEELILIPKVDEHSRVGMEYVTRKAYYMGAGLTTNRSYTLEGFLYEDPDDQSSVLLFDKAIPDINIITDFKMTPSIYETLQIFQKKDKSVANKVLEIHTDLEYNVTKIWQRKDVAIAVDLIYHTVLSFYFQEQYVKRGWGELMLIGDSGQAKTTLVEQLMTHYKLGELVSGESAKRTGLVHSTEQVNGKWFLKWGIIPTNNGGLVVMDEVSGIPETDLANMSLIRSSGVARVAGIITSETSAMTRLIWISNPRNGNQLNAESFGVNAILKLFGKKAEDVRRLDIAVGVASGDIDISIINRDVSTLETVPHIYTSDLCNKLLMWIWSRKPDQIKFTKDAVIYILGAATEMGQRYSSKIPLVEAADQRLKIARLSIAIAARLFSTDDGTNILVEKEHAEFIVQFLNKCYTSKALGYSRMSAVEHQHNDISTATLLKLRKEFIKLQLYNHNNVVNMLYQLAYIPSTNITQILRMHYTCSDTLYQFLTNNYLVERTSVGTYRKLPKGTVFLEYMIKEPVTEAELHKPKF